MAAEHGVEDGVCPTGTRTTMRPRRRRRLAVGVAGCATAISACVGLPGFPPDANDATTSETTMAVPSSTSTTVPSSTSTTGELDGTSSTSTGVDEVSTGTGSTTESEPAGPFVFETAPYDQYVQVDRKGFPLVNTALNLLGDKDAYNASSPADDAALMFATNLFESLETWHLGIPGQQVPDNTGLDDDWASFGLEPCVTPPLPVDTCDQQVGPFAITDVLTVDLDEPSGFPNGRRPSDPVADVILAIISLDLATHDVMTFLDLDGDGMLGPSMNPLENDVELPAAFPYLAPAH